MFSLSICFKVFQIYIIFLCVSTRSYRCATHPLAVNTSSHLSKLSNSLYPVASAPQGNFSILQSRVVTKQEPGNVPSLPPITLNEFLVGVGDKYIPQLCAVTGDGSETHSLS